MAVPPPHPQSALGDPINKGLHISDTNFKSFLESKLATAVPNGTPTWKTAHPCPSLPYYNWCVHDLKLNLPRIKGMVFKAVL